MNTIIADQRQSIRQRLSLSLRKYTAVLRVSVANNLAYIIEVVFRTLFLVVFIFVFEQLWKTTFAIRGITALDGFDINTMIWYLAATRPQKWDISPEASPEHPRDPCPFASSLTPAPNCIEWTEEAKHSPPFTRARQIISLF